MAEVDVTTQRTLTLFDPKWHQGVVGLLAGRIRTRQYRPVIAFSPDGQRFLRGSSPLNCRISHARRIGLDVEETSPLIVRFGGHAMAAGLTIHENAFADFERAFEDVGNAWLNRSDLALTVETDGALSANEIDFDFVRTLDKTVWGQGYPPPSFLGSMRTVEQRWSAKHSKLKVLMGGVTYETMRFGSPDKLPASFDAVIAVDQQFRGSRPAVAAGPHCMNTNTMPSPRMHFMDRLRRVLMALGGDPRAMAFDTGRQWVVSDPSATRPLASS